MLSYLQLFDPYHHILISIALGMLVGLQREWAVNSLAGIRSFIIVSLLGTICALLSEKFGAWFMGVGFLGTVALVTIGRWQLSNSQEKKEPQSLVTEFSILLMYIIGVLVRSESILLAASITCILGILLHVKIELHRFAGRFTKEEIRSIMQFLVITLVVLPVIPDKSFGENEALNLHNIWLMVVLIVGIGLIGYIIYKFAGQKIGILGGGLLGGLISSTATTFSYARLSGGTTQPHPYHALVIMVAWTTLYLRVFLELVFVAPAFNIWLPLLIVTTGSAILISWFWRRNQNEKMEIAVNYNPTNIKTAIFFALFYAFIIWVFAFFKDQMGETTLSIFAFIAGILDMDAITLSTGRLVAKGVLSQQEGSVHLFLALISNTFFKGLITLVIGGRALYRFILIPWAGTLVIQLIVLLTFFF